jgi:hypothetical protein
LLHRVALALIAPLLAAGCGGSTAETPDLADGVPEALQFEAQVLGGGTLDGASLSGQAVLLWFWAPY